MSSPTTPTPEPLTLSLPQLARLAATEQVSLAMRGKLTLSQVWVVIKGAGAYTAAIARGDVRTDEDAFAAVAHCARCSSCTRTPKPGLEVEAMYCGEPFVQTEHTCGCLVGVRAARTGMVMPAGATTIASKACPQGKYSSTHRAKDASAGPERPS